MIKKLLIATGNEDKVKEINELLAELEVEVITPAQIGGIPEVVEDGETLEENAVKKASEVHEATGLATIADDTGLLVDALDGRPGVYSARYAGEDASYEDNNSKLLEELAGLPKSERSAKFQTIIALVDLKGKAHIIEGTCKGHIALEPLGENGFGYDPIFIPKGYKKTFAQLTPQEKNEVSHRGKALLKIKNYIKGKFL
ncbi:XTP/dITP diphosphatase [Fuchsiella alkaliacetigena]|uniref:XTP/dITP diphosphatase n=1 Tax=Fuchsiella alkaliacetigena TaxID=957042 RepID=UPI00200ADB94|nr:XTP/dITP diphosphatase [Fuchsiella alkaliacetigena]MCK8825341.1 XTP/dITP diphosphatase [Fuchsiella alkaliacetigena]